MEFGRHAPEASELKAHTERRDEPAPGARWILVAEDDDEFREVIAEALRREGYRVREVADGVRLREVTLSSCARGAPPATIISDIRMPGLNGPDALLAIRQWGLTMPVIMITAFADDATLTSADRFGATAILDKPFDVDELLDTVKFLSRYPYCAPGAAIR